MANKKQKVKPIKGIRGKKINPIEFKKVLSSPTKQNIESKELLHSEVVDLRKLTNLRSSYNSGKISNSSYQDFGQASLNVLQNKPVFNNLFQKKAMSPTVLNRRQILDQDGLTEKK